MKTAIARVRLCANAQLNLIVGVPAGNNLWKSLDLESAP